jgi:hypothetical protein
MKIVSLLPLRRTPFPLLPVLQFPPPHFNTSNLSLRHLRAAARCRLLEQIRTSPSPTGSLFRLMVELS